MGERAPFEDVLEIAARGGAAARVTVVAAEGSAPQGVGAAMTVLPGGEFDGTIGGGALEHRALAAARRLLGEAPSPWRREILDLPLGPALGQCCGGRLRLLIEIVRKAEASELAALGPGAARPFASGAPARPAAARGVGDVYVEPEAEAPAVLFLYGAGHVGRAVAKAFEDLPFHIFWVDMAPERFPERMPANVERLVARDMGRAAAHAPSGAWHAVMTYDHAIDLDICRQVLARGDFAYLGLIASRTKRARFLARLRASGLPDATVARLHAPLGLPGLQAKSPAVIAASLAGDLLQRRAAALGAVVDEGISA